MWPTDIFCFDCGTALKKKIIKWFGFFSFLIQHLKIGRFHIKINFQLLLKKQKGLATLDHSNKPWSSACLHPLSPWHPFTDTHPPPTPVCDHLSLAPRGQGSAEQQERANTRARGSRITMFHYQPKPLELCFLNSNQKFLKTSTWTVLVHITQSSDWKHMESERKLLQLIWLGTSGQLCCLSLSLRQQDWLLSYSSLPVCRGEGAEKFF